MATLVATARTDADEVKEIFETDLTDAQINAFINTASQLIDDELSNAGLSADLLVEIEKYLAAHLATLRDPRFESEQIGDYRYKKEGKTAMGLDATIYGQQVRFLDRSGRLSQLSMPRRLAKIEVLAKD